MSPARSTRTGEPMTLDQSRSIGFPPLLGARPRVLILGTLPGVASLDAHAYYAHARNAFWPILGDIVGFASDTDYDSRVAALAAAGCAVWDVLQSAQRTGSLDANIREARVNDIAKLLTAHPSITAIVFNGQGAAKLYRRLVSPTLSDAQRAIAAHTLPSTSPALTHAFDSKLERWRACLKPLLKPQSQGTSSGRHS